MINLTLQCFEHFDQFVKFFLLIGQSNPSKHLLITSLTLIIKGIEIGHFFYIANKEKFLLHSIHWDFFMIEWMINMFLPFLIGHWFWCGHSFIYCFWILKYYIEIIYIITILWYYKVFLWYLINLFVLIILLQFITDCNLFVLMVSLIALNLCLIFYMILL